MGTPKEVPGDSPTLDSAAFWAGEVARAQQEWADVQVAETHTGAGCWLCWAGDGDARCQRCGCSVGHPGCQCDEGYLAGPCAEALTPAGARTIDQRRDKHTRRHP